MDVGNMIPACVCARREDIQFWILAVVGMSLWLEDINFRSRLWSISLCLPRRYPFQTSCVIGSCLWMPTWVGGTTSVQLLPTANMLFFYDCVGLRVSHGQRQSENFDFRKSDVLLSWCQLVTLYYTTAVRHCSHFDSA